MDELHKLASELQKMQEFLKSEVDSVQRQIDSAVAGIKYHRRNHWPVEKHGEHHKHIHQALAMCARGDWRPASSNAFADSKGPRALFGFMRSSVLRDRATELGGYDIGDAGAVRLVN